ncbi:BrnA antitoxin family protein [Cereibacter changlensis]|uniref:BrnA antitoxin of type II toxin-antitoxin system n=1 Tax=Cereibacter changlensis TaxID=402884 RepID=A0A2W7R4V0_9RHOB|nr:BrnA antitoxin family protein [Cereibacter changlensis]PZX55191.1 BrnA antitoxin of type II toxin-antitoxin system [Cereibacter changlensis]
MTDLSKQSARQRENYYYMADAMRRLEYDLHQSIEDTGRIPPEWFAIARARTPKRKVRVTLGLEEDVLRFFKSMGAGHGPRINEVLRVYMHARLAGVIRGAETADFYRQREGAYDGERPRWGDTARELGEDVPEAPGEAEREARAALRARMRRMSEEG